MHATGKYLRLAVAGIVFLEDHARWSRLRALGNSGLVQASILMPVFGYMLLLNDNIHAYLTIKYDGWLLNYLPSKWRIWLVFYGSFSVAIASLLFAAFCPWEVKRYASGFEMSDAENEHHQRLQQFAFVHRILKSLYARLSEWERALLRVSEPAELDSEPEQVQNQDHYLAIFLVHQWEIRDVQRPILRITILLLFSVGFILLAIPAIWTFILVSTIALGRLIGL